MGGMVTRRIAPIVEALLSEEPVVALQGPRAVGKTTLLRELAARFGVQVIDLDDLATRDAALADPALMVGGEAPVCIDEYQHAPALLDAIKAELNTDGSPGRFLLTGSTRHTALPEAAQALTGRLHIVDVLPLSQGEIGGTNEDFVQQLVTDPGALVTGAASSTPRSEYVSRVCTGGFPMAVERSGRGRDRWFDNYLRLTLERDVDDLARIRHREKLPVLLAKLAGQTAQVLNLNAIAQDIGLARHTAGSYTELLEAVFLVQQLPAWGSTLSSRAGALPKVHVVDSGLAARLLRIGPERLQGRDATSLQQFGHLLETFVVGECRKQISWLDHDLLVGHWRTRDGIQIDLVVEDEQGRVAAVEVKAGSRVAGSDLRGLELLRDKLDSRFVGGVALYTGARSYTFSDRVHVVPVDRLWG